MPNDNRDKNVVRANQLTGTSWGAATLAVNALAQSLGAGVVVYRTKADMLADRAHPLGTAAWVLIDSDPSANTSYLWDGSSWQASFDRLTFALGNGSGFQQSGAHAVLRAIQDKLRELGLSPTDFFDTSISISSVAADASLQAAIDRANATGQQITIPAGRYKLTGSATFQIDLGKFSIVGEGDVSFDCSEFTGTDVFQIFSSAGYPNGPYKNTKHRFAGITILGGKVVGRHGILVGHASHRYNGQLNIENVAIARFDRNHHYTHNAWRIAWLNCTFIDAISRLAIAPSGLTNAGEVIHYSNCQFSDGSGDIEWACSGWQVDMVGCSVLNTTMYVTGQGVTVNMFGGNIENPNARDFYEYINVAANTCRVTLFGTRLTMNNPSLFTDSPFKVALGSTLQFFGVKWPDGEFRFEDATGQYAFCAGEGLVLARGSTYQPMSGGKKAVLSLASNCLRNGDFEEGTMDGWLISGTGATAPTASISSSYPYKGVHCCRLTSAEAGIVSIAQKVACRPGDLVMASAHAKLIVAARNGKHGFLAVEFFDSLGNILPGQSFVSNVGSNDKQWSIKGQALTRQTPAGAAYAGVRAMAQQGAVIDFDGIVLNVG